MAEIRPLALEDIDAVARLYSSVIRPFDAGAPPRGLAEAFERLFLRSPWHDPETPSYVAVKDGRPVGFIGAYARRFLFRGQPIRLVCTGQLVAEPLSRHEAVGIFLMRRVFAGPQDLTITDGATEGVARMWQGLGGEIARLQTVRWTRILRPCSFAALVLSKKRLVGPLARLLRPVFRALDVAAGRASLFRCTPARPYVEPLPLTAETLVHDLPAMAAGKELRPAYDAPMAEWLLKEMTAVKGRGAFHACTVPGPGPRIGGAYIYHLPPRETASVVHLTSGPGQTEHVLDHLVEHARRNGAVAVQGRVEPDLLAPLARQRAILRYPDSHALIHARRPEILHAIHAGRAMLTRLDGEWWVGTHIDRYA